MKRLVEDNLSASQKFSGISEVQKCEYGTDFRTQFSADRYFYWDWDTFTGIHTLFYFWFVYHRIIFHAKLGIHFTNHIQLKAFIFFLINNNVKSKLRTRPTNIRLKNYECKRLILTQHRSSYGKYGKEDLTTYHIILYNQIFKYCVM